MLILSQSLRTYFFATVLIAGITYPFSVAHAAEVDILFLYDEATADQENGNPTAKFRSIIENSNILYNNNGVDIQLRAVGIEPWFTSHPSRTSEVLNKIDNSEQWRRRREELGADLISWFIGKRSSCGGGRWRRKSNGLLNPDTSHVSWVATDCGYLTFVHELGHNMGLDHSRKQSGEGGWQYDYGIGYGVENTFSTVMAYESTFNTTKLPQFSDPTKKCRNVKCGVETDKADSAYAVKALNNVAQQVAAFRTSKTIVTPQPLVLPGKIEAENYFNAFDTTPGNTGGSYRSYKNVDIQATGDTNGEYNIGWTETGEWLEYEIIANEDAIVEADLRVASKTGDAAVNIFIDDDKITTINVSSTSGSQNYTTLNQNLGMIPKGEHILRLELAGTLNLNWINLKTRALPSSSSSSSSSSSGNPNTEPVAGAMQWQWLILLVMSTILRGRKF